MSGCCVSHCISCCVMLVTVLCVLLLVSVLYCVGDSGTAGGLGREVNNSSAMTASTSGID